MFTEGESRIDWGREFQALAAITGKLRSAMATWYDLVTGATNVDVYPWLISEGEVGVYIELIIVIVVIVDVAAATRCLFQLLLEFSLGPY